ncbi:MAG: hypothetical protein A2340_00230 [Lentisphaerae bacterium RIFOXYB12_FULL_60_10]|nr:MAG: hypothetical protein A2340_00230 [Lentisphaerae bacterium RIFOXYB12_FULL_60_10]
MKVMGRGRFRLENVTITNCLANNMRGGGLYVVGSDMTASNVVFTRNTNKSYADPGNADAGLQVCIIGGRLTLIDSDIDNAAKASGEPAYIKKGVGLYAENASLRGLRTRFRRNKYASNNNASGMGIHMIGGDGWFDACVFETNVFNSLVAGNRGAAVYASGTVPLIFTNCNFTGNYGVGGRGVVCLGGSALKALMTGCVLSNNSFITWSDTVLHENGGVVSLARTSISGGSGSGFSQSGPTGDASLTNCLIASQTTNGISVVGGTVRVVNCTTAGNSGWGILQSAGSLMVQNTIAWNNAAGGILTAGGTIGYTCSQEGHAGTGNLSVNPLFEAPGNGNYRLFKGSPCIDAALTESWMYTAFDLDGRPRKWGVRADMGCYEAPVVSGTVLSIR